MKVRNIRSEDDFSHRDEQANGRDRNRPGVRPPERLRPASRPVETIRRGNVLVSIWANPTTWGGVEWKVSFNRVYSRSDGVGYSRSFEWSDLLDLIQGAFDAKRWIAKAEKRLRGSWFMRWF
jgi:hypothetical protein